MDPTNIISYRKTATTTEATFHKLKSNSTEHNHTKDKRARNSKSLFEVEHPQTLLSSSLSTTYASSTSSSAASTTSEEEVATARRYSDSNRSSSSSSSGSMAVDGQSLSNSSQSAQECANSNAAFVVDEDDLCNNNALIAEAAAAKFEKINLNEEEPSSMIELKAVNDTRKTASSALPKNCFVSLYVNGKRCLLTIDAECLLYEPELSTSNNNGMHTYVLLLCLALVICILEH